MSVIPKTLTIAGSDSGGGAGVQADLKTFSALETYGMSVITALTAQNTREVRNISGVEPDFIRDQIETVLDDIGVDAVKIGMLHAPDVIRMVAETLKRYKVDIIVLDPVMVAKSGDILLQEEAKNVLKKELLPMATVITPNLPEAGELLGEQVAAEEHMENAARALADFGPQAVLLKGGHLETTDSPDYLFDKQSNEIHRLHGDRINTNNRHGTGCTLSSAIAAELAKGQSLKAAAENAKQYMNEALRAGVHWEIGHGNGPVHHFYKCWS